MDNPEQSWPVATSWLLWEDPSHPWGRFKKGKELCFLQDLACTGKSFWAGPITSPEKRLHPTAHSLLTRHIQH